ncbi:MAG: hypothetical protein QF829_04510 [Candidatus Hydrothermarchaeota archaeon]|nr:hypothetical protein [Candidatus Hydrothermarchaeota archaeon]
MGEETLSNWGGITHSPPITFPGLLEKTFLGITTTSPTGVKTLPIAEKTASNTKRRRGSRIAQAAIRLLGRLLVNQPIVAGDEESHDLDLSYKPLPLRKGVVEYP